MSATVPTIPHLADETAITSRPWFGGLEAIRFAAACAVILHHAAFATGVTFRWSEDGAVAGQLLARLDIGVAVFFVLSGFVLYRPFVAAQFAGRPPQRIAPFWIRRVARIYPAYWAALWFQLAVGAVTVTGIGGLVLTTGLLQTYRPENALDGLSQSWTLATEVGFYLALPLFAAIGRRWSAAGERSIAHQASRLLLFCAVLAASSFVFRAAVTMAFPKSESSVSDVARLWTPAHLDSFAAGMALAVLSAWGARQPFVGRSLRRISRPLWLWWGTAAVLFWFLSTQLELRIGLEVAGADREALRQTLYTVVGVAVLAPLILDRFMAGDTDDRRNARWLESRPALWLGSVSYGVYLWHLAVITWISDLLGWGVFEGNFFVMVVLTVPASIAIAELSRRWVEDPVMHAVRRRQGRPEDPGR